MKFPGAQVEIGCQGWNYDDWTSRPGERIFYPQNTRAAEMLSIYARAFQTVEVDSTFYSIPSIATVESWRERTPEDFSFALKLPQQITHERELADSRELLEEFCARARRLGSKLAVVLIQLPPSFDPSPSRAQALRNFLQILPRDMRFSVEFRHPDWLTAHVLDMLNENGIACALVEGPWIPRETMWRVGEAQRTDFAYVRWMGRRDLTRFDRVQRPQDENLRAWSEELKRLAARGVRVFAYFSNFYEGHAPASASKMKKLLGQQTVEPEELDDQRALFG
ncbi:DUF72 domain-containing protein [Pyrinomonas methylaliphatogenes]|uniref:DUF72 domain-containing protein n=1 Tax=Pyrinomonas methylaliphatogenes TaxID=454194 RepID=A0A0B6WTY7_9BACT|nr:DUF72 domain-containing protein [Pyrinomonas methylaliphatogenes]CDM64496.1 hypothetical protein PYK22_00490 [Pyrinomonas methylaliphatogenes]